MSYDPSYHIPRIRQKRRSDEYLRLKEALNRKLRYIYHGASDETAINLIGCTTRYFRKHLRSQFKKGMSHRNRDQWHIDHVKPCASFDLTNEKERTACYHYSNLAPVWAYDNISKKDKF
jgi:hypothetical protein